MDRRKLVRSRLEALVAMGSGAIAEPVAGWAGLAGLLTGRGAQNVGSVRDALTYQPRDPRGLQEIQRAIAPIAEPVERAKRYLGDRTMDATGSPAAAAAAYAAPETLAALLGVRGGGMRGPTMQQMAERSAGPRMGAPQAQVGAIGHWVESPIARSMTRDEFIGQPKITKNANAAELRPRALTTTVDAEPVPLSVNGRDYVARFSPDGAAIYDGDTVIASYNFGDTLAVDKAHRGGGIAKELVYEWRTRYPAPATAAHRTKASQAIQEKVWDRIQREAARLEAAKYRGGSQ